MSKTVPNQKTIKIVKREPFNKGNLYCMFHLDALQEAMTLLSGEHLKLWLYLNKNQDNYQFDLSQKALEAWGLKKDSYYRAVNKLIELHYLNPVEEDSNVYYFSEKPKTARNSEKPKEFSQNAKTFSQNAKENNKEFSQNAKEISQNANSFSQKAKNLSQIAQRNNTIIQNNTDIEQASSAPQKNPSLAPSASQKSLQQEKELKALTMAQVQSYFDGMKYTVDDGILSFAETEPNYPTQFRII